MRILRLAAASVLILTGIVWILQGINLLPGSFMTGDLRWAAAGVACAILGSVLLIWPGSGTNNKPPGDTG